MSQKNLQYDTLLKAVGAMPSVAETIHKDRDAMTGFVGYLTQNEAEISKFGKTTDEVCEYLNKYDFVKGYQFDTMLKKLENLLSLRLKLAKMGEEAKKLMAFPDRYDSKRAIEICRGLTKTCMERMSLVETQKVEVLVETNTNKLIDIQKLFARDSVILSQINAAIDSERTMLSRFSAYMTELKQYVSDFPHQGTDDLAVVKKRIALLKPMVDMLNRAETEVARIRGYADRYGKKSIVDNHSKIVADISSKMHYSDVDMYKSKLNEIMSLSRAAYDAFEKDVVELENMKNALMQKVPIMWKEDNQKLLAIVSGLLNGDPKKTSFDLKQLKTDFSNAKTRRTNCINDVLKTYSWIESKKKYKDYHNKQIAKRITYSEYNTSIEKLKTVYKWRFFSWIPFVRWFIPKL